MSVKKKHQSKNSGMMIDQNLKIYMRMHPKWYLILSRYPQEYPSLLQQYKMENKLTLADRIEKVGSILQMIEMFF